MTRLGFKMYSPFIADVKILSYGSSRLRAKLNHAWKDQWTKTKVENPIIKGRKFIPRFKKDKKRGSIYFLYISYFLS